MQLPEGSAFGTATCAHRVKGGNVNTDRWEPEHRRGSAVAEVVAGSGGCRRPGGTAGAPHWSEQR